MSKISIMIFFNILVLISLTGCKNILSHKKGFEITQLSLQFDGDSIASSSEILDSSFADNQLCALFNQYGDKLNDTLTIKFTSSKSVKYLFRLVSAIQKCGWKMCCFKFDSSPSKMNIILSDTLPVCTGEEQILIFENKITMRSDWEKSYSQSYSVNSVFVLNKKDTVLINRTQYGVNGVPKDPKTGETLYNLRQRDIEVFFENEPVRPIITKVLSSWAKQRKCSEKPNTIVIAAESFLEADVLITVSDWAIEAGFNFVTFGIVR